MTKLTMSIGIHGNKSWRLPNGKLHREDGPAVERADGRKEWWVNGRAHREDGPAIVDAQGNKTWCRNGCIHREDGPAIERADGPKSWYLRGVKMDSLEHFIKAQEILHG